MEMEKRKRKFKVGKRKGQRNKSVALKAVTKNVSIKYFAGDY